MNHRAEIEDAIMVLKDRALTYPFTISLLESYLGNNLKLWAMNQMISDSYGGWTDSTQTIAIYIDKEMAEKAAFDANICTLNEHCDVMDNDVNIGLSKKKITHLNGTTSTVKENCIAFLNGTEELHSETLLILTDKLLKMNQDRSKEFTDTLHDPATDVDKIRLLVGKTIFYFIGQMGTDWFAEHTVSEMRTSASTT